jgi:hypothetical protein
VFHPGGGGRSCLKLKALRRELPITHRVNQGRSMCSPIAERLKWNSDFNHRRGSARVLLKHANGEAAARATKPRSEMKQWYLDRLIQQVLSQIEIKEEGHWVYTGERTGGKLELRGKYKGKPWVFDIPTALYLAHYPPLIEGQRLERSWVCDDESCVAPAHHRATPSRTVIELATQAQADHESDRERFKRFIDKRENGCWVWTGTKQGANSYGVFWLNRQQIGAHRAAHILFKGPVLPEQVVRHSCDDRTCANPDHLSVGTHAENSQDMLDRGRHRVVTKLKADEVSAMRAEYVPRDGELVRLADKYRVAISTVEAIVSGRLWKKVKTPLSSEADHTIRNLRPTRGEGHPNAKLTRTQVDELKRLHKTGMRVKDLAKRFGIGKAQTSAILKGRCWGDE